MKLTDFLKDKIYQMIFLLFAILTIASFLSIYPMELFIKIYIPSIITVSYFLGIVIEYTIKKKFYQKTNQMLDGLDEKYLVSELIESSSFVEGKILKRILEDTGKSMLENVNQYKYVTEDYKEYIELWIHEIKLPIATSKMIIENNKNLATKSIDEELNKVENYVEQALFYARSNTVEKDYYVRKTNLKEIVNESLTKNKKAFIQGKVNLELSDLEKEVYTDSKWLVFILNQVIQNSIKYRDDKKQAKIQIGSYSRDENVVLSIQDNGIGIKKGEETRVFEKGFTGTNGRRNNQKSTGIGLYLCKKLCDKLGIGIEIKSDFQRGTEVKIIFPKSSYLEVR